MTATDEHQDTGPPLPLGRGHDATGMLEAIDEALVSATTPAGSVAGTDVQGLLQAAEAYLDRAAELHAAASEFADERRTRQLSTIVDHLRRIQQSDSTGYTVGKAMPVLDAAVQLEFDARSDLAERAGDAQLIDEACEQLESTIRRIRPVVSGIAGGELTAEAIRDLRERVEGLTRWVRQLEPIATTRSGD